jgi:hypothetical protein
MSPESLKQIQNLGIIRYLSFQTTLSHFLNIVIVCGLSFRHPDQFEVA